MMMMLILTLILGIHSENSLRSSSLKKASNILIKTPFVTVLLSPRSLSHFRLQLSLRMRFLSVLLSQLLASIRMSLLLVPEPSQAAFSCNLATLQAKNSFKSAKRLFFTAPPYRRLRCLRFYLV